MLNELFRRLLFLPEQRSTIASGVDRLHYLVIGSTMLGATIVAFMAAYFMIRYRRRDGQDRSGRSGAGARPPIVLETLAVVVLAVLFLAFWVIGARQFARIRVIPEEPVVVYVTAKQWMWKFAYPEGPNSVSTLYVPARRPVKLVLTSRDVIHSFFVPAFRIKYDAVPGRYTTLWFEATEPGTYPILCTEYCGTDHSRMRGEVVALGPVDYARWLRDHGGVPPGPREPTSLVRLGERVAAREGCLRCHTLDGTPHIGPSWAGLYMAAVPLEGGGQMVADEAYLTESMMDPAARLHAGYPAVMPSYLGRLRPAEVAALVEYIRSIGAAAPPGEEGRR